MSVDSNLNKKLNIAIIGDEMAICMAALYIFKSLPADVDIDYCIRSEDKVLACGFSPDFREYLKTVKISEQEFSHKALASPLLSSSYVIPSTKPYFVPYTPNNIQLGNIELHQVFLQFNSANKKTTYDNLNIASCLSREERFTPASKNSNSAFFELNYGFSALTKNAIAIFKSHLLAHKYTSKTYLDIKRNEYDIVIDTSYKSNYFHTNSEVTTDSSQPASTHHRHNQHQTFWLKSIKGNRWQSTTQYQPTDTAQQTTLDYPKITPLQAYTKNTSCPLLNVNVYLDSFIVDPYYALRKAVAKLCTMWPVTGSINNEVHIIQNEQLDIEQKIQDITEAHYMVVNEGLKKQSEQIIHRLSLFDQLGKTPTEDNAIISQDQWIHLLYALGFNTKKNGFGDTIHAHEIDISIVDEIHQCLIQAAKRPPHLKDFLRSIENT